MSGRLPRRGRPGRRLPLHFVPIPDPPLATLEHAVQVLAVQRGYDNLNAAVEQYTGVLGEPPLALVSCLSRTVSLLTLPWDDDVLGVALVGASVGLIRHYGRVEEPNRPDAAPTTTIGDHTEHCDSSRHALITPLRTSVSRRSGDNRSSEV